VELQKEIVNDKRFKIKEDMVIGGEARIVKRQEVACKGLKHGRRDLLITKRAS